jgi:hypothetical protein
MDILAHYGVKGMKWGVRRDKSTSSGPAPVVVTQKPGQRVKTSGGERQNAHEDAITAATRKQIAKKSSTDALSDKELQALINRMNLEQNYARLTASPSKQFVTKFILGQGQQSLNQAAQEIRTKKVAAAMAKAVV